MINLKSVHDSVSEALKEIFKEDDFSIFVECGGHSYVGLLSSYIDRYMNIKNESIKKYSLSVIDSVSGKMPVIEGIHPPVVYTNSAIDAEIIKVSGNSIKTGDKNYYAEISNISMLIIYVFKKQTIVAEAEIIAVPNNCGMGIISGFEIHQYKKRGLGKALLSICEDILYRERRKVIMATGETSEIKEFLEHFGWKESYNFVNVNTSNKLSVMIKNLNENPPTKWQTKPLTK